MVRCHGQGSATPPAGETLSDPSPPELIKVSDPPSQNDYIALFLGDDEDQSSADRSIVTFLAVPSDSLQVAFYHYLSCFVQNVKFKFSLTQDAAVPSSSDSNLCVFVHAGNDPASNSTNQSHILWSWQTTSPVKSIEDCSDFGQSTINMRDLE